MKERKHVIIIGAGICGLSIAKSLLERNYKVTVLEARDRTGGRIQTLTGRFAQPLEAGAEFIHGDLPLTKALAKKAGATINEMQGQMYRSKNGRIEKPDEFIPGMEEFLNKAKKLEGDMSLASFLLKYFPGLKYSDLRSSVTRMAEGFDAADTTRLSVKAVYDEWSGGELDNAYLIKEGYGVLVSWLTARNYVAGMELHLNKEVEELRWSKGKVVVNCSDRTIYFGDKVILTVPLGIITAPPNEPGSIFFVPHLRDKISAARKIGYGPVIKVVMEFRSKFWNDANSKLVKALPDLGFLMTDGPFPVYWTYRDVPTLTAWAGGSRALQMMVHDEEELLEMAIAGLALAFNSYEWIIYDELVGHTVFNWGGEPYSRGAYSYVTPETEQAKKILREPVEDTVYFAGEALGESSGTVEAALESAEMVVKRLEAKVGSKLLH